jgi:hypothetical protein
MSVIFVSRVTIRFKGDTHSWTHWLRTSRKVMDDLPINHGRLVSTFVDRKLFLSLSRREHREILSNLHWQNKWKIIPHPPSPQIVMEILSGSASIVSCTVC